MDKELLAAQMPVVKLLGIGLALATVAVPVLVGLLTPGRKGSMRTERTVAIPSWAPQQAMAAYAERLRLEGFRPMGSRGPYHVLAERTSKTTVGDPTAIHTHASKGLRAELSVAPAPQGSVVTLVLTMTDPVILDTGEGAYIDATLARLVGADLSAEPAPLVANRSFNAQAALFGGGLTFLASVLAWLWPDRALGVALATVQQLLVVAVLGALTWREVLKRPGEMQGGRRALVGLGLVLAAMAVAWTAVAVR